MTFLLLSFAAGFAHGVGPDHLAAITAYGSRAGRDFQRLALFAVRFALGHAAVIVAAAAAGYLGVGALPEAWAKAFEIGGGLVLVATGVVTLYALASGRLRMHSHVHAHDASVHAHMHAHVGGESHRHPHGVFAFALGGLWAIGGTRALLLSVPMFSHPDAAWMVSAVVAFTAGIVASMVLFAWAAQSAAGTRWLAAVPKVTAVATAVLCLVGGGWILSGSL